MRKDKKYKGYKENTNAKGIYGVENFSLSAKRIFQQIQIRFAMND